MSEIGQAIKDLREALGDISQERFARRIGTTTRTIARWEASNELSPQILSRLRGIALGCKAYAVSDLFEQILRDDLGLDPDESLDDEDVGVTPGTPEERELVAGILIAYRAEDSWAMDIAEQVRARNAKADIEAEARTKAARALLAKTPKLTLRERVQKQRDEQLKQRDEKEGKK